MKAKPRGMQDIGARRESGDPGSANLRIGISEPLWPREYWDRYIRNEKHLRATIAYIEQNPVKADLCSNEAEWRWTVHQESQSDIRESSEILDLLWTPT